MNALLTLLLFSQMTVPSRPGDTWRSLALRIYGDTLYAETLRQVNGGHRIPRGVIKVPEIPAYAEVLLMIGKAVRLPDAPLQPGSRIQEGDTIKLEAHAYMELMLSDGSRVRLEGPTTVSVRKLRRVDPFDLRAWFHILRGKLEVRLRHLTGLSKDVEVTTPSAKGSIRGTWTALRAETTTTWNMVFTGKVNISNDAGRVTVPAGQGTVARKTLAPLPPRPLPPPPTVSRIPERILLAGRQRAPLSFQWTGADTIMGIHLTVYHSSSVVFDSVLSARGSLTLPISPGLWQFTFRSIDDLGLESRPIHSRVQVGTLP